MAKITLRAARVSKGWTQEQLAERLGVSRSTVFKWENGQADMRPAYFLAFCNLTGFDREDILLPEECTLSGQGGRA